MSATDSLESTVLKAQTVTEQLKYRLPYLTSRLESVPANCKHTSCSGRIQPRTIYCSGRFWRGRCEDCDADQPIAHNDAWLWRAK